MRQTQQPLIVSNAAEETRWPRFLERVRPTGGRSCCSLPLTTARRRLGTLAFACKQPSDYDAADLSFLQLVANQVALAVENALAFQEIEAFKDKLSQEKVYLEREVRTQCHLEGASPSQRRKLSTVMPVLSDQRLTKSTRASRVSWGTQAPVRVPQALFLAGRAPP